jgi:pimeloyl-ACP methyl ester carboxylesterase
MKTLELPHRRLKVAYDDVGTGVPVVLLHAFPFDRGLWEPQFSPLTAAGFRVLALDTPGFGGSTLGPDPLTIDGAADVLADFFDALGIRRAVVGGLSMGGYVALAFARRHADHLMGLILADTKAGPDDEAGKANRDKMIATVRSDGPKAVADALLPKLLSEQTQKSKPEVVERAKTIAHRQTADGIAAALAALRDREDAAPGLTGIAVPTLVLVGEHDTVTPPLAAARLAGSITGSTLVHVPGAGHLSNLENPAAFNDAVLAFLKKLK